MLQVLELRTFGTPHVVMAGGAPMAGAAGQRRLLALLSILAVGGDAGVSRDRLLTLLWPDGDPEKSRHALTQTLYHARRALGLDDLFIMADGAVRLNPLRITSDVARLDGFIHSGDLGSAAAIYRGPFLDGFFLAGSNTFEEWSATTRDRLASRAAIMFGRLGAAAASKGDWAEAVRWRARAVELDPLNSPATLELMNALDAAGDRAGALQLAHVHAVLLRTQLDIEPDLSVSAAVERLRTSGTSLPSPVVAASTTQHDGSVDSMRPPMSADSNARMLHPMRASGFWTRRLKRVVATSSVFLVLAVATVVLVARTRTAAAVPFVDPPHVIVAPFRVSGADQSFGFLREGMVELLLGRLMDDQATPPVDPGAAIRAWRDARFIDGIDKTRGEALVVARRLGAAQLVVGSVVGSASRLVLSASLLDVAENRVRAVGTVEGPADSLTTLVDHLAMKLLAARAGEGERFADRTTSSIGALRAFLRGQAAYHRGEYSSAAVEYEAAMRADSTFALAALYLALSADRVNNAEQHDRALAIAWANRADLSPRDAAHLMAFAGPRYPAPSTQAEQLAEWQHAVALAPDRSDVWYEMAERLFHEGAVLGVPDAPRRAVAASRRALELDPGSSRARRLMLLASLCAGDTSLLASVGNAHALRDSMGVFGPFLRWRTALVRDDLSTLSAVRASMFELSNENLRAMAMTSLFDDIGLRDGERAMRILRARAERASAQMDALLALHAFALSQGHAAIALDITGQLEEGQPGSRIHLRLRVLDALYGSGDKAAAAKAADALAASIASASSVAGEALAVQLADVCVLEQWRLANGVTTGTARAIDRFRSADAPRYAVPVGASPLACGALLDAMLAVATRKSDALTRVMRVDSLMLSGAAVGDASNYSHIVVAQLYDKLGRGADALGAIRRRAYLTGWPRYLATARREERRLALTASRAVPAEVTAVPPTSSPARRDSQRARN